MSKTKGVRLFTPGIEGRFIGRPNRFLLLADTPEGPIRAHSPNPGRLEEFLLPEIPLLFEKACGPGRKTAWSLAAARYRGHMVPLHSGRANNAAGTLVLPRFFPGGKIRPEVTHGDSRFDFLVSHGGMHTWVEVKSCTLAEYGTAMFPDAPTERGRRHILHLAKLAGEPNTRAMVLFILMNREAERFIPHFHTDPAFSLALRAVSDRVDIRAVTLHTGEDGYAVLGNPDIPVDLTTLTAAEQDCGVYLLVLELPRALTLTVGSLGVIEFRAGWYVYAGSGKKNLSKRIARHLRKGKNLRWHIDYLSQAAGKIKAYPIYTRRDLECALAADVAAAADGMIPGFGCSDCRCESHLFYFNQYPVRTARFQEVVLRYRHKESTGDQGLV